MDKKKVKSVKGKPPETDVFDYSTKTVGDWGGLDCSPPPANFPLPLTMKTLEKAFEVIAEPYILPLTPYTIGGKVAKATKAGKGSIIVQPKKVKPIKVVKRTLKMTDFDFPPVKKMNTRLASKSRIELGEDILNSIRGLKI